MVQKIRDAQPSSDAKELKSFLGPASYYRRIIKGFSKEASPLSERISENVVFERKSEMQESFESLRQTRVAASVLAYPDFAKPFIVATGASKRAIGAVLSQKYGNRREKSIHSASCGLNNAEKNYSTYEREEQAILFALKKFRHYVSCQKFMRFANHEALKYVINTRNPMEG